MDSLSVLDIVQTKGLNLTFPMNYETVFSHPKRRLIVPKKTSQKKQPAPCGLTMAQVSKRLTRIASDLDAVASELEDRGFSVRRLDRAAEILNPVYHKFCDDLDAVPSFCFDTDSGRCPARLRDLCADADSPAESEGDGAAFLEGLHNLEDPRA